MALRRIDRLGLDGATVSKLKESSIVFAKDLLEASPLALMMILDISYEEADMLLTQVSSKLATGKAQTALAILGDRARRQTILPTGVSKLDETMRGGLYTGCISEICGPPGIGKTQFCIGCCVESIAMTAITDRIGTGSSGGSSGGGVVYVDTEQKFDSIRLVEVAIHRYPTIYSEEVNEDANNQLDLLLGSVKVMRPSTCKELYDLTSELQTLVISEGIKLIIIDSIAALARKEALNEQDKEQFVVSQAATLKKLAEVCGCVVLATNQVTPDVASSSSSNGAESSSSLRVHSTASGCESDPLGLGDVITEYVDNLEFRYRPALGPTWHHCVTTRLVMYHSGNRKQRQRIDTYESHDVVTDSRIIVLTKSPIAGPAQFGFLVEARGISTY